MTTDWTAKCPPFDTQFSEPTLTDIDNCVEESISHIMYALTGYRVSPRALSALMYRDGTLTKAGSDVTDCVNAVNKYGFILYDDWPTPQSFTYAQYLELPPPEVLAKAFKVNLSLVPPDLNVSPLWTETGSTSLAHMVMQINETQYFDSEPGGAIKPFNNPIYYQTSVKIQLLTQPHMITFVHITGTPEYAFEEMTNFSVIVHRAINEADIKFMAVKFGVSVLNPDGTINFSLAKEISI
jgi:hypothetical protein